MHITKTQLETIGQVAEFASKHLEDLDAALDSSTRHNTNLHKKTPNIQSGLDRLKTISVSLLTETISDSILLEGTINAALEPNNSNTTLNPLEQEGVSSSSSQQLVE